MQRNKKAMSLIYLACGFVVWLVFREALESVWVMAHMPQPVDWVVPPSDLVAASAGLAAFIILFKSERVNIFANEVITELVKVVWPSRKETVLSTGVVSVLVGICAMILFVFDMMWGSLVKIFYR